MDRPKPVKDVLDVRFGALMETWRKRGPAPWYENPAADDEWEAFEAATVYLRHTNLSKELPRRVGDFTLLVQDFRCCKKCAAQDRMAETGLYKDCQIGHSHHLDVRERRPFGDEMPIYEFLMRRCTDSHRRAEDVARRLQRAMEIRGLSGKQASRADLGREVEREAPPA